VRLLLIQCGILDSPSGQAPFEVGYRYTSSGHTSRRILKAAQETGILHLDTAPGHHRYDFIDLRDSNYPNTPVALSVEHDVHSRPSASFTKGNTKPLCLDSSLKGEAKIRLEGKAPFTINLAIKKPASSRVISQTIQTDSHEWTLDIPSYTVTDIGRHEIIISSITDSSGCDQVIHDSDKLSTIIEVVESARIVPVSQVTDLCVGDTLDFLLQGKSPWTIEYEWQGKKHAVTSSASRFSRFAEAKGTFEVKSVALKDNQVSLDATMLVPVTTTADFSANAKSKEWSDTSTPCPR
jgi:nucleoporin POM152